MWHNWRKDTGICEVTKEKAVITLPQEFTNSNDLYFLISKELARLSLEEELNQFQMLLNNKTNLSIGEILSAALEVCNLRKK